MAARIVRHVLPDFSAEKLVQLGVLIELLDGLADTDLLRVIGTAFHSGTHRWPDKTVDQWVAAAKQTVDELHDEGFG